MISKKLLSITLVSILLLTSASLAIGGTTDVKQIGGTGTISEKISGILSSIINRVPFLSKLFSRIAIPDHSHPPQTPPKPRLVLDLKVDEKFQLGQDIPVTAVLTNYGTKGVYVCDIALEYGTLDFYVTAPAPTGIYTLHYIGKIDNRTLTGKFLAPNASIESKIYDLKLLELGPLYSFETPNQKPKDYFNTTGTFTIKGIYKSFEIPSQYSPALLWKGTLESHTYTFYIGPAVE